jgi:phospholipase/lecithinase/hemolysin
MRHVLRLTGLVLIVLLSAAAQADVPRYSAMYVFGDSLMDPGNIPAISGADFPPFPYVNHQLSNGPVAVQYLAPLLCLPVDNSKNFAQGGATTGYVNVNNGVSGGDVPGSYLTGLRGEVDNYLAVTSRTDPRALYAIWAGPNDLLAGLRDPANFDPAATIGAAMNNLSIAILELNNAGARRFLVMNMPDLGIAPRLLGTPYQSLGMQLSAAFNQQLAAVMAQLSRSLNVEIVVFDASAALHDAVANPAPYHLTNVTQACMADPICVTDPRVADGYLFWDDIHPTTRAHQILAGRIAEVLGVRPGRQACHEHGRRRHGDDCHTVHCGL